MQGSATISGCSVGSRRNLAHSAGLRDHIGLRGNGIYPAPRTPRRAPRLYRAARMASVTGTSHTVQGLRPYRDARLASPNPPMRSWRTQRVSLAVTRTTASIQPTTAYSPTRRQPTDRRIADYKLNRASGRNASCRDMAYRLRGRRHRGYAPVSSTYIYGSPTHLVQRRQDAIADESYRPATQSADR